MSEQTGHRGLGDRLSVSEGIGGLGTIPQCRNRGGIGGPGTISQCRNRGGIGGSGTVSVLDQTGYWGFMDHISVSEGIEYSDTSLSVGTDGALGARSLK